MKMIVCKAHKILAPLLRNLFAGKGSTKEKKPEKEPDPQGVDYTAAAQRDLTSRLGRGVRIVSGRKKGRIELEYYGVDDLNDLLEALALLRVHKSKEATSERT